MIPWRSKINLLGGVEMDIDGQGNTCGDFKDAEDEAATEQAVLTPEDIRARAAKVDANVAAAEVLEWLQANVEQYIDNQSNVFRLYLEVSDRERMPQCSELRDLYLGIPPAKEDDEASAQLEVELLDHLDAVTANIHEEIVKNAEGMDKLFKRLVFFYEMTGYSKLNGPIIQEMKGVVKINEFMFDPIPMQVTVAQPVGKVVNGEVVRTGEKRVTKTVECPAAFGVELEIEVYAASQPMALY
jgi:hypothetical protein